MLGFSNYRVGKLCRVNNVGILSVNIFTFYMCCLLTQLSKNDMYMLQLGLNN